MNGGRNDIVRGLAEVDVVVGVYLARTTRTAEQFAGAVSDHLVGVHVGRGARTRLKNIDHELVIKLAINHFLRGLHDSLRNLGINQAEVRIDLGGGLFDLSQGADELTREAKIADRKIQHGALRTRAIICVSGNAHLSHRIAFDARLFCALNHRHTPLVAERDRKPPARGWLYNINRPVEPASCGWLPVFTPSRVWLTPRSLYHALRPVMTNLPLHVILRCAQDDRRKRLLPDKREKSFFGTCGDASLAVFLDFGQLRGVLLIVLGQDVHQLVELELAPVGMAKRAFPGLFRQRGKILKYLFTAGGHTSHYRVKRGRRLGFASETGRLFLGRGNQRVVLFLDALHLFEREAISDIEMIGEL